LPFDFDILAPSRDHHALREQPRTGSLFLDQPDIAHHLGEEARVDQVQNGVLHAADVLVDREPVGDLRRIERRGGRSADRSSGRNTRTNRRTCPWYRSRARRRRRTSDSSRSRIRALFERRAALAGDLTFSGSTTGSWSPARAPRRISGNGSPESACPNSAGREMPQSLMRNVMAALPKPSASAWRPCAARFFAGQPGPFAGILHDAVVSVNASVMVAPSASSPSTGRITGRSAMPYLRAEFEIALIVRGHGHDGAGAVAHQDEVADPHREPFRR
jgi:hypothetical protein